MRSRDLAARRGCSPASAPRSPTGATGRPRGEMNAPLAIDTTPPVDANRPRDDARGPWLQVVADGYPLASRAAYSISSSQPPIAMPAPSAQPTSASYASIRSGSTARSGCVLARSAHFSSSTRSWYSAQAAHAASTASITSLASTVRITPALARIALGSGHRSGGLAGSLPGWGLGGRGRHVLHLRRLARLRITGEARCTGSSASGTSARVHPSGWAGGGSPRPALRARRSRTWPIQCSGAGWWSSRLPWCWPLALPDAHLASRCTSRARLARRCEAQSDERDQHSSRRPDRRAGPRRRVRVPVRPRAGRGPRWAGRLDRSR